ncbi:MAG: ATP-binding protein [Actinomycetota bacterium]
MTRGRQLQATTLLIWAVSIGGAVALAAACLADPPSFSGTSAHQAGLLLGLTAVSELVAIRYRHGRSAEMLTLFELAVVADIVLLPASMAALVSIGGLAVALVIRRRPLVKFIFNLGQYAVGIVPAIGLYHTFGGGDFDSTAGLLAIVAGMAIFTAGNLVTISAIIAATTDRPLRKVLAEEGGMSFSLGLGNSAVGMVAVSLYLTRPELLPAVLAPTLALHLAFGGWVKEKELSRKMEEESTKLGRILEHSSEGIVLADASGAVLLWSPSMERATGVSREEATGKALSYLLRGKGVFGQWLTIDVSAEGEPVDIEIIAADGTPRWLRVQHGPGFDERGELTFDVLVVTDVTRQREVDRLKDDFFSTVSHELRTPLTPIKGYASLLLRRMDDLPSERRREAVQSILERTDHMARLVEDMLLASRIANTDERRMPEVNRQPVAVVPVVERALRSFRVSHPSREFRFQAAEDLTVLGDAIRIEQVVANLVSNAVKFSDDGAPVDVEAEQTGKWIQIRVRDEGRGIPPDRTEEIFEKFKRLEDPLRMETGGAGLGLFIVRQLALAMGGSVQLESELGSGSTFTVLLPVSAAAPALPQRRRSDLPQIPRAPGDPAEALPAQPPRPAVPPERAESDPAG